MLSLSSGVCWPPSLIDNLKLAPRTPNHNAANGSFRCNVGVFAVVTTDT